MNQALLKKYADLKNQIKALELEVDAIQPEIMAGIEAQGADEVQTDFGKFILGRRRTYTYPEALVVAETNLKADKKEAEATGSATYVEKPYLLFKSGAVAE